MNPVNNQSYRFTVDNVCFLRVENNALPHMKAEQAESVTCYLFHRFVVTASNLIHGIKKRRYKREGNIKHFPDKLCRNSAIGLCVRARVKEENVQEVQMHHITERGKLFARSRCVSQATSRISKQLGLLLYPNFTSLVEIRPDTSFSLFFIFALAKFTGYLHVF